MIICILILLLLVLFFNTKKITIKGGNINDEATVDAWKTTLFSLKLRANMNVFCWKLYNIREYLWQFTGEGNSTFADPKIIENSDPLMMHSYNRKFETFFYTTAGVNNSLKLFPYGPNLTVETIDRMMKDSEYYATKNICKYPINDYTWERIENPMSKAKEAYAFYGFTLPDNVDTKDKLVKYTENLFENELEVLVDYYKKILNYNLDPLVVNNNGKLQFKLINPRPMFYKSEITVEYGDKASPYYPDLFRKRNSVNTKIAGNEMTIEELLAMITMSHFPVFTRTHLTKNNIYSIYKSPGLMTSPVPKINKQMRELPWVKADPNEKIIAPFWSKESGVPNYFLEGYASPLNHNAEIFCSLFPNDKYANGCIGRFDKDIIKKFNKKWTPRIVMANPPYTDEQFFECNILTDIIHKHYKTITVTTISKRDGTLFDSLMKEPVRPVAAMTKSTNIIMKPIIESPYLYSMYVIPESTFIYACLFTDEIFSVSSREGERPTDTILIIKTTDPNLDRVKEIEQLFIQGLPKNEKLRTEPKDENRVIKDIEVRRDKQGINPKIMNREFIKNIIRNTNLMVSGRP